MIRRLEGHDPSHMDSTTLQHLPREHHQSVSALIREGLEWRMTEGDPCWQPAHSQRSAGHTAFDALAQPVPCSRLAGRLMRSWREHCRPQPPRRGARRGQSRPSWPSSCAGTRRVWPRPPSPRGSTPRTCPRLQARGPGIAEKCTCPRIKW